MSTKKDLARISADAMDVIGDIANTGLALPIPAAIKTPLAAILAITKAVQAGLAREIKPEVVIGQIEDAIGAMNESIANNRAADQAELDAKFGPKPTPAPSTETPSETPPTE